MPENLEPKVDVLLGDEPWETELAADFVQVKVTDRLDAADLCLLQFDNPQMRYQGYARFRPGTTVTVSLGWGDSTQPVFFGEVVGTEFLFPREGPPRIEVKALDRLFRLQRRKQERTLQDVSDSDVAEQIAQEHGLRYEGDTTTVAYPYLMQSGVSDWDFLVRRADASGRVVRIEDRTLTFRDAAVRPDPVRTLSVDDTLPPLHLSGRIGELPTEVRVRGWDPKTKEKIEGTARVADLTAEFGLQELGAGLAESALGPALRLVTDVPVTGEGEAEMIARSVLRRAIQPFLRTEFTLRGDPELRAGTVIEIAGLGRRLSGRYAVHTSHHELGRTGYTTRCELWRNGWLPPPPETAAQEEAEEEPVDIEAVIVDALGNPLPDLAYTIHLADGSSRQGQTDGDGNLFESGCPRGTYRIENEEFNLTVLGRT